MQEKKEYIEAKAFLKMENFKYEEKSAEIQLLAKEKCTLSIWYTKESGIKNFIR